jgi:iron complex outermembrane receptor protein
MGYRDWEYYNRYDHDRSASPFEKWVYLDMDVYGWSQELQVIYGNPDSKLSAIGGLFYYSMHEVQPWNLLYTGAYWESNTPTTPTALFITNIIHAWVPGIWPFAPNPERKIYFFDTAIDTNSYAVYAQGDYQLTDKLNITMGLRFSVDDKEGWEQRDYLWFWDPSVILGNPKRFAYPAPTNPLNQQNYWIGHPTWSIVSYTHDQEWEAWLYRLSADYKPSEESLLYANVSRGYKSGGFVLGTLQPQSFEPEFLLAYEAGWKQLWAGDRYRTNTSVYFYDYEDMQIYGREANEMRVSNAAAAENYGIELEATGYVIDNLLVGLTYSWCHAEYVDFISYDQTDPWAPESDWDRSGNRLNRTPEHKFAGTIAYTIPSNYGDFVLSGMYFWQGETYHRPYMTWRDRAKPWDRTDVKVQWHSVDYKTRITLSVNNVFNSAGIYDYGVDGPYTGYQRTAARIAPMVYVLEISYKW